MAAPSPAPARPPRRPQLAPQPPAPAQVVAALLGGLLVLAGLVGLLVDASFDTGAALRGGRLLGLEVNGWHNVVHLATGLLLLGGLGDNARARRACGAFAAVYLAITLAGLIGGDHAFGLVPINAADDVLHAALALVALWAAARSKDRRDPIARDRVVVARAGAPHVVGPGSGHVGGPRVPWPSPDRRAP